MTVTRGRLITLEGVDGAGKSTHVEWLTQQLRALNIKVISTREPGGTPLGEKLRTLILSESMRLETETLLIFAARIEHVHTVIEPALIKGTWVICDRFTDATYAYQGGGRQLGIDRIANLECWMPSVIQPDRTWLFDVPVAVARDRVTNTRELDRFEREGTAFFERTRAAYYQRVSAHPARIKIVNATHSIEVIRTQLYTELIELLEGKF